MPQFSQRVWNKAKAQATKAGKGLGHAADLARKATRAAKRKRVTTKPRKLAKTTKR